MSSTAPTKVDRSYPPRRGLIQKGLLASAVGLTNVLDHVKVILVLALESLLNCTRYCFYQMFRFDIVSDLGRIVKGKRNITTLSLWTICLPGNDIFETKSANSEVFRQERKIEDLIKIEFYTWQMIF